MQTFSEYALTVRAYIAPSLSAVPPQKMRVEKPRETSRPRSLRSSMRGGLAVNVASTRVEKGGDRQVRWA